MQCAALDTSGSGPPGGSADGLAVLAAGAAVPSRPTPSHGLSRQSLPNQPIAPASLCDAISGVMPGPDEQGCCFCPSDITPARDGPAHTYPDDAVRDGAIRRSYCIVPVPTALGLASTTPLAARRRDVKASLPLD